MFRGKKVAVIIAAGGFGRRLGGKIPKQYRLIEGKPVIVKAIEVFEKMPAVDYICVVTSDDYREYCRRLLIDKAKLEKITMIVKGGVERQDSVLRGLLALEKDTDFDYVMIHDAARPFVTESVAMRVLTAAIEDGAAVAAVRAKDSIRLAAQKDSMGISKPIDRERAFSVQTPQAFERKLIRKAYKTAYDKQFYASDDSALVDFIGERVVMVEGDYANIKITTKEDWPMEVRIGKGFDVHPLVEGRKLILGGTEIPFEKGLDGHSDADVLVHAIMDALLGAANLGDIGRLFPDTEPIFKSISSLVLLEKVGELLREDGLEIVNIDATVIAEEPKISGIVPMMKANICNALRLDQERLNIKGTTTERLGFTGRGEGIAAEAVCSLER
ncbi:MAG: 2-C-methyl-D-erythritol 4-phosphate cytidylyltransferase [Clostridia bacterium]|nr:2-C-methyl-D-erythritol 4-phosphate cytidylyltransferase [Clostridia bacterium]